MLKLHGCIHMTPIRFFFGGGNPSTYSVQLQSLSRIQLCDPCIAVCQAYLSITKSRSLLSLMSIELVMPSRHLILCRSLLLLTPIPPSIRVYSNELTLCMRWPKYWSLAFAQSFQRTPRTDLL